MLSKARNLTCTKKFILLAALLFSTSAFPQTQPVHATIDASKTGAPISKYIYGQFLEYGGHIVNEGVWAEMPADRKFYYPVSSKPPEEPSAISGAQLASQGHLWRMAPDKLTATKTVGQKPEVEVQKQGVTSVPEAMSLPPFSISIYSFPVR